MVKSITEGYPLLDFLTMLPLLKRYSQELGGGKAHVTLGFSQEAWAQIASKMTNSVAVKKALGHPAGTIYFGESLNEIETRDLEVIIPYLLRPTSQAEAVGALKAMSVRITDEKLLGRPLYASLKARLACVQSHVHRFTKVHEYAVASSYRMDNGVKLVTKHQGIQLFMSPKGLSGRQKDDAILSILKEQLVRRVHLIPEGLFDDIFMPRQRGSTFPTELTNLTRQVKELITGDVESEPPAWENPEEYKCVVVSNEMLKAGRKLTEGMYNTVARNIEAVNLFLSVSSSFNRLCYDPSPRRPESGARLANVETTDFEVEDRRLETARQYTQPYKTPTSGAQTQGAVRERGGCYPMADSGVRPFREECKFSHKPEAIKATRESEAFKRWRR